MNKTKIKNYAVAARKKLIAVVTQKAFDLGITETEAKDISEISEKIAVDKTILFQREQLIATIKNHADDKGFSHGHKMVCEEVAYTWFNRLVAIRFMEVNGYLPHGVLVLSSLNTQRLEPDCLRDIELLGFVDVSITKQFETNEMLYKHILIAQCNELSKIMPKMFQPLSNYTELLLPDNLYQTEGIVFDLVHGIDAEDFKEEVEIIGWLYQYYISEKKDEVFSDLKKNVKITKENIPAATQLFTPDWIVKYMVENSLGRIAVDKLNLNPKDLGWKYYIDEAEQTAEVQAQLNIINTNEKEFDIKNVKIIDPCMGSGHILVYAFDVLYQIYESIQYLAKDIPNMILTHNIVGLDIDDRAGQLAYFALMMRARSFSRRFFRQEEIPQPKVYAMIESDGIKPEHVTMFDNADVTYLVGLFSDAKEYGSILKIEREIDYDTLINYVSEFKQDNQISLVSEGFEYSRSILLQIIEIARALSQKYDVVVTNPPYMGGSGMSGKLSEYVKKNFSDSKSDLFSCFIEQGNIMAKLNGYNCMVTMQSWMFLSSFEKMRKNILIQKTITNLMHMDNMVMGIAFGTAVVVIRNATMLKYKGTYNQVNFKNINDENIPFEFPVKGNRFSQVSSENFAKIPGMPVAYWVSEKFVDNFKKNKSIKDFVNTYVGMRTGDNERFLRLWYEISFAKLKIDSADFKEVIYNKSKWVPYLKGGDFRKWYINYEYVVNWENNGFEIKENTRKVYPQLGDNLGWKITSEPQYFKEGITFNAISSSAIGFKRYYKGAIFSNASHSIMHDDGDFLDVIIAFLNSKVVKEILSILTPTINFTTSDINKIPFVDSITKTRIIELATQNIELSKTDWDNFETSWDFKKHPFITYNFMRGEGVLRTYFIDKEGFRGEKEENIGHTKIKDIFKLWKEMSKMNFDQLKQNEEELNRIFIEIYGLQDELTPDVLDKDVTIRKADLVRDVKSFISYAVGCMFGRYSLDCEGLAFAGGAFDNSKYKSFSVEAENIIPLNDNDYFDNDILLRFVQFVKVVFGDDTIDVNLDFIANAIYPNGVENARTRIRKYFTNDFFKDHVKIYKKKPIYWQFDSGKLNGFRALVYLHRYDDLTVSRVRTNYLHPLQSKYEAEISSFNEVLSMNESDAREIADYKKKTATLQNKIAECRTYEPVVAHLSHLRIKLDLDDGVSVNYAKFQGVSVPLDTGKEISMDCLSKI